MTNILRRNRSDMMGSTAIKFHALSDKLQRNIEDYGCSVAVNKICAHLFGPIYFHQVYRIYKINLDGAEPQNDFGLHDFTFRVLTTQDTYAIGQVEKIGEWLRGELSDRIATGQLCLVVFDNEKVVGFNLVSF